MASTLPFDLKVTNIGITFAVISWLSLVFTKRLYLKPVQNLATLLGLLLFLIVAQDYFHTSKPSESLSILETKTSFLAFPILLAPLALYSRSSIALVLRSFVLGLLVALILTLLAGASDVLTLGSFSRFNAFGGFTEYFLLEDKLASYIGFSGLYLGYYVLFAIAVLLFAQVDSNEKKWTTSRIVMVVFLVLYLVLLKKASNLGYVGVLILLVLFTSRGKTRSLSLPVYVYGAGALIIGGLFVIIFISKVGSDLSVLSYDFRVPPSEPGWNSLNFRLANWSVGLDALQEYWFTGTGAGEFRIALNEYHLKNGFWWGYYKQLNPHNEFIESFLRDGILGFSCLLALLILCFKIAVTQRDYLHANFLLLFLFVAQFESVLSRNKGVVFFCFFLYFFYFSSKTKEVLQR